MTVKRQEELECVCVKDLDRRVEQRDCQEPTIWTVFESKDVVGHFQCPNMGH